jgi:biotin carboxyl carrier protein
VDADRVDPWTLSLIIHPKRVSCEAGLAATTTPGTFAVHLRGGVVEAHVVPRDGRWRAAPIVPVHAAGVQRVTSPMPGRIVRVLVAPGDEVAARQGLVVVEAMKMENELRAPGAGQVREVLVTDGMSVEAGRLLVTIE